MAYLGPLNETQFDELQEMMSASDTSVSVEYCLSEFGGRYCILAEKRDGKRLNCDRCGFYKPHVLANFKDCSPPPTQWAEFKDFLGVLWEIFLDVIRIKRGANGRT